MDKLIAGARKLGIELTLAQVQQFEQYYQLLAEWNQKFNLTAIVEYEKVQLLHFLDSLTVVLGLPDRRVLEKPGFRVMDVGTGAGLPGIPLKIAFPDISLCLNDSVHKKGRFLSDVVDRLGLKTVEVVVDRAEELGHSKAYRERFDLALARAVAEMAALAEICLPFCRPGARFIAQKKGNIDEEINRAGAAIRIMGGAPLQLVPVSGLEELGGDRCLVVIEKVKLTPPAYPRKPGMPAKKPVLR